MTNYEVGMLAASWFAAVGTCGAVLFAVFSAIFKRWLNCPKLSFQISADYPNCNLVSVGKPQQAGNLSFDYIEGCGYVQNDKPYCAKGCQVMCAEIYVPDADGSKFCRYRQMRPRQFPWTDVCEDIPGPIDIPQSLTRYVKIFEIRDVREMPLADGQHIERASNTTQIVICLTVDKKEYVSVPNEYRSVLLPIRITSSGIEPLFAYVRVDWKGCAVKEFKQPGKLKVTKLSKEDFDQLIVEERR